MLSIADWRAGPARKDAEPEGSAGAADGAGATEEAAGAEVAEGPVDEAASPPDGAGEAAGAASPADVDAAGAASAGLLPSAFGAGWAGAALGCTKRRRCVSFQGFPPHEVARARETAHLGHHDDEEILLLNAMLPDGARVLEDLACRMRA